MISFHGSENPITLAYDAALTLATCYVHDLQVGGDSDHHQTVPAHRKTGW
jgi:hypothetical protein